MKDYYIDLLVRAICPKCRGGKSELGYTWQVVVHKWEADQQVVNGRLDLCVEERDLVVKLIVF